MDETALPADMEKVFTVYGETLQIELGRAQKAIDQLVATLEEANVVVSPEQLMEPEE